MEKTAFEKDKSAYLIFACKKCQQYSYVKTSQKTKKCLRCGRSHQVKDIMTGGEIVYGMTFAVDTVKKKQNELVIPEFRTQNDFVIKTKRFPNNTESLSYSKGKNTDELDCETKFKSLLYNLSKLYGKFPAYMIEIMAEDAGISQQETQLLIEKFKKKGFLNRLKDEEFYYKISR